MELGGLPSARLELGVACTRSTESSFNARGNRQPSHPSNLPSTVALPLRMIPVSNIPLSRWLFSALPDPHQRTSTHGSGRIESERVQAREVFAGPSDENRHPQPVLTCGRFKAYSTVITLGVYNDSVYLYVRWSSVGSFQ